MMPGSLSMKIGAAAAVVVALALALTTLLNALRFQETYERLASERFRFVAAELRTLATLSLDFGLELEGHSGLLTAMQRELAVDDSILAITIHDCEGGVLLQAGGGEAVTDPWLARLGQEEWRVFGSEEVAVGLLLRNSIGQCAAGVVIEFSSEAYAATLGTARRSLIQAALLALIAAPLAGAFAAPAFRRNRRVAAALERDLDALSSTAAGTEGEASPALADARREAGADAGLEELLEAYAAARPQLAAAARAGDRPEPGSR